MLISHSRKGNFESVSRRISIIFIRQPLWCIARELRFQVYGLEIESPLRFFYTTLLMFEKKKNVYHLNLVQNFFIFKFKLFFYNKLE